MSDWTQHALEDFFDILSEENRKNDLINISKVRCGNSELVPGQKGVFANQDIKKGEIIEWGVATTIPGLDVTKTDNFYTWSTTNRKLAATVSGCGLFYNTLGDNSNARCVPYHSENRFEVYALRDIDKDEEITFRYDSMNYREGMSHLIDIVGQLRDGDQ